MSEKTLKAILKREARLPSRIAAAKKAAAKADVKIAASPETPPA